MNHPIDAKQLPRSSLATLPYDRQDQLGPAHKQARAAVDRMVQEDVRTLCGVALSNGKYFPCKFVACYAIALVGDRFTLREDQERCRDLWYACERSHGFPPTATVQQLEESWGWHNH